MEGGDMYESQKRFHAFVESRSPEDVKESAKVLNCPVLEIDATSSIDEIVKRIYDYYSNLLID